MSSISSLCAALQTSTTHVVDGLRNFVTYYPQARLDLASLSRELAELQMVARLLHHNAQALESGSAPLPGRLDEAIKGVVSEAGELLEEADDALDTGRTAEERTPSWLEHTAERLSPFAKLLEGLRSGMSLGLDCVLLQVDFILSCKMFTNILIEPSILSLMMVRENFPVIAALRSFKRHQLSAHDFSKNQTVKTLALRANDPSSLNSSRLLKTLSQRAHLLLHHQLMTPRVETTATAASLI